MKNKCGRRKKKCAECGHRFPKSEYDLWDCPECGTNRACNNSSKLEDGACRLHGGDSLSGELSPRWKDGLYAKYLPSGLLKRHNEAKSDPELLSLVNNLANIDVRMTLLAERLEDRDYGENYTILVKLWQEAQDLTLAGDLAGFAAKWQEIGRILNSGASEHMAWKEFLQTNDMRKGMVATIEGINLKGEKAISIGDHLALVSILTNIFLRHITDEDTRRRVAADIRQYEDAKIQ